MSDGASVRVPGALPEWVSQATIGVRGGLLRSQFEEAPEAMYLTSGYVYETAADAEKGVHREDRPGAPACFATATGMAAVFTALGALLGAGDRLVAARSLFGSCFVVCNEILPRWGVETPDLPWVNRWCEGAVIAVINRAELSNYSLRSCIRRYELGCADQTFGDDHTISSGLSKARPTPQQSPG